MPPCIGFLPFLAPPSAPMSLAGVTLSGKALACQPCVLLHVLVNVHGTRVDKESAKPAPAGHACCDQRAQSSTGDQHLSPFNQSLLCSASANIGSP